MKEIQRAALARQLAGLLARTELTVNQSQQSQLVSLVTQLHKWNKAYNLTAVREPDQMLVRHIMDSLLVGPYLQGERIIDVGTGPGLPGLPLAICHPERDFVLLDSLGKRVRFMRQVIHELELTNVTAVQARVQDYQPDQPFDTVLSRAFASLADMLGWCHHLVSATGSFMALKGQYDEQEVADIPTEYRLTGVWPVVVPDLTAARHILQIQPGATNE